MLNSVKVNPKINDRGLSYKVLTLGGQSCISIVQGAKCNFRNNWGFLNLCNFRLLLGVLLWNCLEYISCICFSSLFCFRQKRNGLIPLKLGLYLYFSLVTNLISKGSLYTFYLLLLPVISSFLLTTGFSPY